MLKLFIVDDHPAFREGIKFLVKNMGIANVINEAADGQEFLNKLDCNNLPDVVLMDIDMPELDGREATRLAIEKYPLLNVLVLTMFGDEKYYQKMIQLGVKGFILKTSKLPELESAIKTVAEGGNYFSAEILKNLVTKYNQPEEKLQFSDREIEILQLICQGFTNEEIAEKINLSVAGVKYNRTNLFDKTNCSNSASLVIFAIKNKIISI